jgi:hypothetical protein
MQENCLPSGAHPVEIINLILVYIHTEHLVSHMGKTGRCDQTDITGAYNTDLHKASFLNFFHSGNRRKILAIRSCRAKALHYGLILYVLFP